MGKTAWVYPGQGAQYPGMGADLYKHLRSAKATFEEMESLRPGTMKQCFEGSAQELAQTKNTQPCLHVVSLAAAKSLEHYGFAPDVTAGFSLGEYAALTSAQTLGTKESFRLVEKRGELMQEAGEASPTSMLAVVGLPVEEENFLTEFSEEVYVVNYNCPGQVVVAGEKGELRRLSRALREKGVRSVPLKVSGAFHSPIMQKASDIFSSILSCFTLRKPTLPVYANATAQPYEEDSLETLKKQMTSPVYWQKTIENMIADGVDTFVECGAGKTLSGMIQRISPNVNIFHVEDVESLHHTLRGLSRGA